MPQLQSRAATPSVKLLYHTRLTHLGGLDGFKDMVLREYRPSGQDNAIYITSDTLTHGDLGQESPALTSNRR